MKDNLPPGDRRGETETVKIPAEVTGLNAACYLHAARDGEGRLCGLALSSPGKFEGGAIDRLFGFLNAEIEARFALPAALADSAAAGGFFERHTRQRLALQLALPELCEDLEVVIASYCLWQHECVDGTAVPQPESVTDPDALEVIFEKLAAVAAVCEALGEAVTEDLARVLPALPQHRCADISPQGQTSNSEAPAS
jgi:hypothetical protein